MCLPSLVRKLPPVSVEIKRSSRERWSSIYLGNDFTLAKKEPEFELILSLQKLNFLRVKTEVLVHSQVSPI